MKKALLSMLLLPLALVAVGSVAQAGGCPSGSGTLTVDPGTATPGGTVAIEACGLANGFALLAVGETPGATPIGGLGPIPSATICLDAPFALFPLGATGTDGCADLSISIPEGAPLPGNLTLHLQGVLFGFTISGPPTPGFSIALETTNTATLTL